MCIRDSSCTSASTTLHQIASLNGSTHPSTWNNISTVESIPGSVLGIVSLLLRLGLRISCFHCDPSQVVCNLTLPSGFFQPSSLSPSYYDDIPSTMTPCPSSLLTPALALPLHLSLIHISEPTRPY
eukprot:TRINITY_DN20413_c0_g1_i1.p1 TRINITY_DN20413_c0_g1~~TRINITY_DN20413_c0_g1_i1.p1  ORF type:complete len:126 (+),score=18.61 TRINITY_DN20413_c0_g1_i1:56-433(+)